MRNIVILSRNSFTDLDVKTSFVLSVIYFFETTEIHSYAQTIFYNKYARLKLDVQYRKN